MINDVRLKKLAELSVKVGVNVQPGQLVVINTPICAAEFARSIAEEAYKLKAGNVIVNYRDEVLSRLYYQHASDETLQEVPDYEIEKLKYYVEKGACLISIASSNPYALKGISPEKMVLSRRAMGPKTEFFDDFVSSSRTQWLVVSYPNLTWAKTVFKDLDDEAALDKLYDSIMDASRVTMENDVIQDFKKHLDNLEKRSQYLNSLNLEALHFKNDLGTDLFVTLAEDHVFAGGKEMSEKGIMFAPNIPTEEIFTMPFKTKVNGTVVSTKPLNYQGNLIKDFKLNFVNGKVVNYEAKEGLETLKSLIELDEGSSYLGEVALISYDSPISRMNILFNNTLFDENASCHLALGNSYSMNIIGGTKMSLEELEKRGYNKSITHVDFMFGSKDLEVTGILKSGESVKIFEKGNFK